MSPEAWAAMCVPINEVLPGDTHTGRGALFIGSWMASVDDELLHQNGINQLVSVNDGMVTSAQRVDGRGSYRIIISDSTSADLQPYLDDVCRHIDKKLAEGENVLVHCQQASQARQRPRAHLNEQNITGDLEKLCCRNCLPHARTRHRLRHRVEDA